MNSQDSLMQRNHRGVIASYKASFMPPTNRRATLCGRSSRHTVRKRLCDCAEAQKAHDRDLDIPGDEYYNPVLNTLKCQGGRKRWKINAFCLLICPSKCCMWRAFEFSQFKNFSTIYLMFLDNIACDSARR